MRLLYMITITLSFSLACFSNTVASQENLPSSLTQWYKPDNKRNVWQHNMFKLRRELQAIVEYQAQKDQALALKWTTKFATHYRKIATMVPEWQDELELNAIDTLESSAKAGDFVAISRALKKIKTSCKGCHSDYRAQVAAVYRAPDYSDLKVSLNGQEESYISFMKILMHDINGILIATADGQTQKAQSSLSHLKTGMHSLRASCDSCHEGDKAKDYYLGTETLQALDALEHAIDQGDVGRKIGKFAVQACAHCHGSHRILYDLTNDLKSGGFTAD